MQPNTGIDGASSAAETLEELVKKYGYIKPVDEEYFNYGTTPCLVLRLATGDYYEIRLSFTNYGGRGRSGSVKKVKIGTNQFKYDRGNSDASESFSPEDLVPPMVKVGLYGVLAPYIVIEYTEIPVIIIVRRMITGYHHCAYVGLTENITYYGEGRVPESADGKYYMASTQKYNNRGNIIPGAISLIPEEMVPAYFADYNKHLRNNAVTVTGRFNLSIEELMKYNLYSMKLFDGQKLLPVSLRYEVGKQLRCLEAKFKFIKDFADSQEDQPIDVPVPIYQWQLNQTQITAKQAELQSQATEGLVLWRYDETDPYVKRIAKISLYHLLPHLTFRSYC